MECKGCKYYWRNDKKPYPYCPTVAECLEKVESYLPCEDEGFRFGSDEDEELYENALYEIATLHCGYKNTVANPDNASEEELSAAAKITYEIMSSCYAGFVIFRRMASNFAKMRSALPEDIVKQYLSEFEGEDL